MAKRTMRGRRRPARKGLKKRSNMRKRNTNVMGGPNTAKITETYSLPEININTPEEYFFQGIPANSRAAAVAPTFGLYRIARVTYRIKPLYDTYIPSNQGPTPSNNFLTSVPNLYWKINRYGDAPAAFDAGFLREQGSKAVRLDDKTLTISYRPNILLADAGAAAAGLNGGSGQVKMTPWLSTDNEVGDNAYALSTTVHYGHLMYVEGDTVNGSSAPIVARVEAKVVWEFKNPRGIRTSSASQTVKKVIQLS